MFKQNNILITIVSVLLLFCVGLYGESDSGELYDLFTDVGVVQSDQNSSLISFYDQKQAVSRFREVVLSSVISRERNVKIGDKLMLNLFDDREFEVQVDRVVTNINDTYTVRGRLTDYELGYILISTTGERSLGSVYIPELNEEYEIISEPKAYRHYLIDINRDKREVYESLPPLIPEELTESDIQHQRRIERVLERQREDGGGRPDNEAVLGVMIVYTPSARSWANTGGGGINNVVAQAVERGQLGHDNSNTLVTVDLVHSAEVDYEESGSAHVDLYRLTASESFNPWGEEVNDRPIPGFMDEVHEWRREYGADNVAIFANVHGVGGLGWLLSNINGMPNYSFNLNKIQQAHTTSYTYIHEVGHNMGMHHHKDQNFQPGPTEWGNWEENTWSAGWRGQNIGGQRYCTIMTYASGQYFPDGLGHSRIPYFSNPAISFQGFVTGHLEYADNVRTIREMKHVMAAYSDYMTLEGYVYEAGTDDPVSGAKIEIVDIDYSVYTDEDGYFYIYSLDSGETHIRVERLGYFTQDFEDFWIDTGIPMALEVQLEKFPNLDVIGKITGSDFPEEGIEGAEVRLVGLDTFNDLSDEQGNFLLPRVYKEYEYRLFISAEGYDDYVSVIYIEEELEELNLGIIVLQEKSYPVRLVQSELSQEFGVEVSWLEPQDRYDTFRRDDGIPTEGFGLTSGSQNTVFGTVFDNMSQVHEVSWYLTERGGPHEAVIVSIFGLGEDGKPDSSALLFRQDEIPNIDGKWNTYRLPRTIEAPNGFLVGFGYVGNIGIAIDTGISEDYPFSPGTQYIAINYQNGVWQDIVGAGYPRNFLIRARGFDYEEEAEEDRGLRELERFVVYRFSEDQIDNREEWTEIIRIDNFNHTDTELFGIEDDHYHYAVIAEYTNGLYSLPSVSARLELSGYQLFAPHSLEYQMLDFGRVELIWEPATSAFLDGYNIYRDDLKINDWAITDDYFVDCSGESGNSYSYYVTAVYGDLESEPTNTVEVLVTSVEDDSPIPLVTKLGGNYPNPFNPETTISYTLSSESRVTLNIFDIKGRMTRSLHNGSIQHPGDHKVVWDGKDNMGVSVGSGIYFYRMTTDGYTATRKMLMLK